MHLRYEMRPSGKCSLRSPIFFNFHFCGTLFKKFLGIWPLSLRSSSLPFLLNVEHLTFSLCTAAIYWGCRHSNPTSYKLETQQTQRCLAQRPKQTAHDTFREFMTSHHYFPWQIALKRVQMFVVQLLQHRCLYSKFNNFSNNKSEPNLKGIENDFFRKWRFFIDDLTMIVTIF